MHLQQSYCKIRQRRLLNWMNQHGIELSLVTSRAHVHYLTGALAARTWPTAAILRNDGELVLFDHTARQEIAADRVILYQPQTLCTINPDLNKILADLIGRDLARQGPCKAAIEYAHCYPWITQHHAM